MSTTRSLTDSTAPVLALTVSTRRSCTSSAKDAALIAVLAFASIKLAGCVTVAPSKPRERNHYERRHVYARPETNFEPTCTDISPTRALVRGGLPGGARAEVGRVDQRLLCVVDLQGGVPDAVPLGQQRGDLLAPGVAVLI